MKSPRLLFLQGGWSGHKPEQVVDKFRLGMRGLGWQTETVTSLERLAEVDWLRTFDLISPCWTMGSLKAEESAGLREAVRAGTGLGGIHGGMGDAFRGDLDYEWMVGGHFVGHPHVGEYKIHVTDPSHGIMRGLPAEFSYTSEQYYMLVDPSIRVLARTDYTFEENTCKMPVVWTKNWGKGRVFYSALGHDPVELEKWPHVFEMSLNGMLWAGRVL